MLIGVGYVCDVIHHIDGYLLDDHILQVFFGYFIRTLAELLQSVLNPFAVEGIICLGLWFCGEFSVVNL